MGEVKVIRQSLYWGTPSWPVGFHQEHRAVSSSGSVWTPPSGEAGVQGPHPAAPHLWLEQPEGESRRLENLRSRGGKPHAWLARCRVGAW